MTTKNIITTALIAIFLLLTIIWKQNVQIAVYKSQIADYQHTSIITGVPKLNNTDKAFLNE